MSIIPLFKKTNNAKNAGAVQILNEAISSISNGDMADKVVVISMKPNTDNVETVFLQSGMSAIELISLLELAKLNIYRNFMKMEKII